MESENKMKRSFRRLAMLLAAVIILSGAAAAFAEEEKVYTLPIDLSGGMPYKDSSFNKENPFKWSDDHHHYEDPTIVADYYKLNGKQYGTVPSCGQPAPIRTPLTPPG